MILPIKVRGVFATNSYFYIDDETLHGFLIDPGAEDEKILKIISEKNFVIEKILLTHGHFDHTGAAAKIQNELNIPICMQKNGRDYAENPFWNLSAYFDLNITLENVTYLEDYCEINSETNSNFGLELIPVSGHTTDGAIFYGAKDKVAFVGDSIFRDSIGQSNFPGGNREQLYHEVTKKILTLPPETVLLSGHSGPTTVKRERLNFGLT